ncbi:MAG TPA: hypothetical protein VIN63_03075 [Candidatus Limnocylindria bacterium]
MTPALRAAVVAIAAAAVAALLFPVYLRVLAGDSRVFEPQVFDFALVAIATFAIAVGAQIVPWRKATNVAVMGTLVGAGLLFGVLAIFSIGVLVLPVAIVLLVVLARAIGRAPLSVARPAALGGAISGYGLVLLFIALIIPPTVECFANGGGSSSSQRWGQSGGGYTVTSSGSSTVDGVQTGTIESSGSIATYRCEQGRIVEFHREAR